MNRITPKWLRELEIFERIKPIIILGGNIHDMFQYPGDEYMQEGSILGLVDYLHYHFKSQGYANIICYDSIRGFYNHVEQRYLEHFCHMMEKTASGQSIPAAFSGNGSSAVNMIGRMVSNSFEPSVAILDYASRYISGPENLEQSEVDSYTQLLQAAMESADVRVDQGIRKNLIVLLVDKVNDLPTWFYLENPNVKYIQLSTPERNERRALLDGKSFKSFFAGDIYAKEIGYFLEHSEELNQIKERFVALTEGFCFTELNGLRRLCKNERIPVHDLCEVVDLYKYGIRENPWKNLDFDQLQNATTFFRRRVKGQEFAITRTLDIIKRAACDLNGIQGSSHGRPKGVLFFAGPTGTGKTETAKTLAQLLFGDESLCIRFDMSEYSQPHSDQRLLGAPPGYVGYEAGGQLTNAVKKNPFSILLFDEIEKAHPSILDKFLQILEDGRMTDGHGETVYFSETVIIFTSNLGIFERDEMGRRVQQVDAGMDYQQVRERVRSGISRYFKSELGRPEILNRIGENIVIFDFIRENVATQIMESQLERICSGLREEKRISLELSEQVKKRLMERILQNLENGGRGISNVVENMLVNALARELFARKEYERGINQPILELKVEDLVTDEEGVVWLKL